MNECKISEIIDELSQWYPQRYPDLRRLCGKCDICTATVSVSEIRGKYEISTTNALCGDKMHGLKIEVK